MPGMDYSVDSLSFGFSAIGKSSTVYDFDFFYTRARRVIFMFSTRVEMTRVRSIFMYKLGFIVMVVVLEHEQYIPGDV